MTVLLVGATVAACDRWRRAARVSRRDVVALTPRNIQWRHGLTPDLVVYIDGWDRDCPPAVARRVEQLIARTRAKRPTPVTESRDGASDGPLVEALVAAGDTARQGAR